MTMRLGQNPVSSYGLGALLKEAGRVVTPQEQQQLILDKLPEILHILAKCKNGSSFIHNLLSLLEEMAKKNIVVSMENLFYISKLVHHMRDHCTNEIDKQSFDKGFCIPIILELKDDMEDMFAGWDQCTHEVNIVGPLYQSLKWRLGSKKHPKR